MKKSIFALLILLAGCTTGAPKDNADDGPSCGGAFSDDSGDNSARETVPAESIVLDRTDVQVFRGTEMVNLLRKLDSADPEEWLFVRRHVHPAPESPFDYDDAGNVTGRNFDWPATGDELSPAQKAWRSYLLWPEHIRRLLHQQEIRKEGKIVQHAWNSEEVRKRLVAYGRMYALLHQFQTREPHGSDQREFQVWQDFAESLQGYGDDGTQLLVANMIVALSNPSDRVVGMAQDILVDVGPAAIEPLCAAMWTAHRQLIIGWEEEVDPNDPTGMRRIRTEVYKAMGNPNYNRYIADTLYRIGPRAMGHAIIELEESLDANGQSIGTAWRFRRWFIDVIGRLGPLVSAKMRADALKALELEIGRVIVEEYDEAELAKGKRVIDEQATDDAAFLFREYLIKALGDLGTAEAIRPILRLWKMDDYHEVAALSALGKISNYKIKSMAGAREYAEARNIDLKGE